MIWNFGWNLKDEPEPKEVPKRETITFNATDNCYERARKIFWALSIGVDSHHVAALAGMIALYKELDENAKKG